MKRIRGRVAVLLVLAIMLNAGAQEQTPPQQKQLRIGVLDLEVLGTGLNAEALSEDLVTIVAAMKDYKVYSQQDLRKAFTVAKLAFPRSCREILCAIDIGSAVAIDRMLFGIVENGSSGIGMQLTLTDVVSKQVIQTASMKAVPGVAANELLKAAVAKLHGRTLDGFAIATSVYLGPEIHREGELLAAAGVTMGAGVLWALASGVLGGKGAAWEIPDVQSGIPSNAYHIPLFARPGGLANAYLAVSDDACGVLYNPAGMGWITAREVSVGYQRRFSVLNNFAASYVNRATRELGFGSAFLYNGDADGLQTEVYFVSAAGYKFHRPLGFLRPLSVGAAAKLMTITSPERQTATASQKTFGLGFDLGVLMELSDQIRYGLVLRDLPSFQKVVNTIRGVQYTQLNPATLSMGGAFKAGYSTLLVANGQIPLYADQPWRMGGGIEQEMFRVFKARIGMEKQIQTRVNAAWKLTGGFGLQVDTDSFFGKIAAIEGSYEYNTFGPSLLDVLNLSLRFGF